jgi:hypothetical protein
MKSLRCIKTVNEVVAFDIDEYINGNKDMIGVWVDLPSWLQTKIDDSIEVKTKDNKPSDKSEFESLDSMNQEKAFPSDEELADDEDESLPF